MGSVYKVMDKWYAYGRTRVLGPFDFRKQAERALIREDEE